jgi:hypothetical protein
VPLDHVNWVFRAPAPNTLWLSDFTYVSTWSGFAYVAFVIDAYARRIVGWRVSRTAHASFVLDALEQALHERRPVHRGGLAPCIIPTGAPKADTTGRRNTKRLEVVTMAGQRASDRCTRRKLRSPGRPPAWQREHYCRFWQAIARGRTSEEAAADAGISAPLGPRWFRSSGGMPPTHLAPSAPVPAGRYLSFGEREEIAIELAKGTAIRAIARKLARSPSTVSREVRRNAATRGGNLDDRAIAAQWHADRAARRPRPGKLASNPALRAYVERHLSGQVTNVDGTGFAGPKVIWKKRRAVLRQSRRWSTAWSPEQIAHRLRIDYPEVPTCASATRRYTSPCTSRVAVHCVES